MFKYHQIASLGRGRLFASPKPEAEDLTGTLDQLADKGISHILCLLETKELELLGLTSVPELCAKRHITFMQLPIEDFSTPSLQSLATMVGKVEQLLRDGNQVLIHCRGGIGRTGILCSCVLIAFGRSAEEAMQEVTIKRGCEVPETPAQIELIKQYQQQRS